MKKKFYAQQGYQNLPIRIKLGLPLLIVILLILILLFTFVYYHNTLQQSTSEIIMISVGLMSIAILTFYWLLVVNHIIKPLEILGNASEAIVKGNLETEIEVESYDEIGKIASSTQNLVEDIKKAREFTKSIGEGNYNTAIFAGENYDKDSLFNSLIGMQNQLKELAEQDQKRNWITKGLAEFSDILQSSDTDLKKLGNKIITGLVRYLGANQGGLFVLNNNDAENTYLELTACYAYDEVKFNHKKIAIEEDFAEGLIGQAFLEKDKVYITDIPDEYVNISSGLGQSNPKSILIVPLELNGAAEGVVEIASLHEFEEHEILFVERLAENIASAVLSIKVNDHTKKLLKESQELTQRLQVQEQEIRQNYEELQATQEEIKNKNNLIEDQKKEIEKALEEQTEKSEMLEAQEEEMRQNMEELVTTQEQMMLTQAELDGQLNAINGSSIAKIEFNLDGTIVSANQTYCELVQYKLEELKGMHHLEIMSEEGFEKEKYEGFWANLRKGIPQTGEYKRKKKNKDEFWINAVYSPVKNKKAETYKIIKLAFDITEAKNLLVETQNQAKILQTQEGELRQHMQEIQNKAGEIESKNQLITASIQYAKNIQRAILPSENKIKELVSDFFVIYLPKDIVSGDFYWFSDIDDKLFFAAVDCTGHGVPGAFMSIIGNTLLNEIVNVQKIFDTDKILEMLHLGVRTKLRQAESSNYDGMDISLCMIEKTSKNQVNLSFSGAKRSLYYIQREEEEEVKELKGDRKGIGGWQKEVHRTFCKQEVLLQKGDLIYLMSDGLEDNPNNKRKKFGAKRIKSLILGSLNQSLDYQKKIMLDALIEHQQEAEQRDDITIFGVRI